MAGGIVEAEKDRCQRPVSVRFLEVGAAVQGRVRPDRGCGTR